MTADVFDRIYKFGTWNGVESASGPGSGTAATRNIATQITDLIKLLSVRSVLNYGCGDDFWTPEWPGYVGADVSEEALTRAIANHPDRRYELLPRFLQKFDLIICRDVLQHLSRETAQETLTTISEHGRYLLLSTYMSVAQGHDIEDGGYTEPNLMLGPFSMGPPMLMLWDGYAYEDGGPIRDPRKFLGLWKGR